MEGLKALVEAVVNGIKEVSVVAEELASCLNRVHTKIEEIVEEVTSNGEQKD